MGGNWSTMGPDVQDCHSSTGGGPGGWLKRAGEGSQTVVRQVGYYSLTVYQGSGLTIGMGPPSMSDGVYRVCSDRLELDLGRTSELKLQIRMHHSQTHQSLTELKG